MPASVLTMVGLKFPNLFSIIMLSGGVERRGVSIQLQLVSRKNLFVCRNIFMLLLSSFYSLYI